MKKKSHSSTAPKAQDLNEETKAVRDAVQIISNFARGLKLKDIIKNMIARSNLSELIPRIRFFNSSLNVQYNDKPNNFLNSILAHAASSQIKSAMLSELETITLELKEQLLQEVITQLESEPSISILPRQALEKIGHKLSRHATDKITESIFSQINIEGFGIYTAQAFFKNYSAAAATASSTDQPTDFALLKQIANYLPIHQSTQPELVDMPLLPIEIVDGLIKTLAHYNSPNKALDVTVALDTLKPALETCQTFLDFINHLIAHTSKEKHFTVTHVIATNYLSHYTLQLLQRVKKMKNLIDGLHTKFTNQPSKTLSKLNELHLSAKKLYEDTCKTSLAFTQHALMLAVIKSEYILDSTDPVANRYSQTQAFLMKAFRQRQQLLDTEQKIFFKPERRILQLNELFTYLLQYLKNGAASPELALKDIIAIEKDTENKLTALMQLHLLYSRLAKERNPRLDKANHRLLCGHIMLGQALIEKLFNKISCNLEFSPIANSGIIIVTQTLIGMAEQGQLDLIIPEDMRALQQLLLLDDPFITACANDFTFRKTIFQALGQQLTNPSLTRLLQLDLDLAIEVERKDTTQYKSSSIKNTIASLLQKTDERFNRTTEGANELHHSEFMRAIAKKRILCRLLQSAFKFHLEGSKTHTTKVLKTIVNAIAEVSAPTLQNTIGTNMLALLRTWQEQQVRLTKEVAIVLDTDYTNAMTEIRKASKALPTIKQLKPFNQKLRKLTDKLTLLYSKNIDFPIHCIEPLLVALQAAQNFLDAQVCELSTASQDYLKDLNTVNPAQLLATIGQLIRAHDIFSSFLMLLNGTAHNIPHLSQYTAVAASFAQAQPYAQDCEKTKILLTVIREQVTSHKQLKKKLARTNSGKKSLEQKEVQTNVASTRDSSCQAEILPPPEPQPRLADGQTQTGRPRTQQRGVQTLAQEPDPALTAQVAALQEELAEKISAKEALARSAADYLKIISGLKDRVVQLENALSAQQQKATSDLSRLEHQVRGLEDRLADQNALIARQARLLQHYGIAGQPAATEQPVMYHPHPGIFAPETGADNGVMHPQPFYPPGATPAGMHPAAFMSPGAAHPGMPHHAFFRVAGAPNGRRLPGSAHSVPAQHPPAAKPGDRR